MKNYTSTVPAERSIAKIEAVLAKHGADEIVKTCRGGKVAAIAFRITEPETLTSFAVALPANVPAIHSVLLGKTCGFLSKTATSRILAQAERTAWKLMLDWIEVQMSLIEMRQAELLQVFLPYVIDGGKRSFYELLRGSGFKALPKPEELSDAE
jgi:hypothetical protein